MALFFFCISLITRQRMIIFQIWECRKKAHVSFDVCPEIRLVLLTEVVGKINSIKHGLLISYGWGPWWDNFLVTQTRIQWISGLKLITTLLFGKNTFYLKKITWARVPQLDIFFTIGIPTKSILLKTLMIQMESYSHQL